MSGGPTYALSGHRHFMRDVRGLDAALAAVPDPGGGGPHAEEHRTTGADPITPTDIGAAPLHGHNYEPAGTVAAHTQASNPHPIYAAAGSLTALLAGKADVAHTHPPSGGMSKTVLASDVTAPATANTLGDVTGLSFAVVANQRYRFKFTIRYTAAAATTGSRWSINGPAASLIWYSSEYTLTATSRTLNDSLTAYNLPAASNASSIVAGNRAVIEGFLTPTANGTVIARFASEIASSAIVARSGSLVEWESY